MAEVDHLEVPGILSHPQFDHFSIETHGDFGIPHFETPFEPYCATMVWFWPKSFRA